MNLFSKRAKPPSEVSLQALADILEKGNKDEEKLLWQPKANDIVYLPVTFHMIEKLKKPEDSFEKLSVYRVYSKKDFTLVIFKTPWIKNESGFSPLIIENATGRIVGVMLAFNELNGLLSKQQDKEIAQLGITWTMFVIKKRSA